MPDITAAAVTVAGMNDQQLHTLTETGQALGEAVDDLAASVLEIDGQRVTCGDLAGHYDDFAARMADQYPSLAGPASKLAGLFRELDATLGRLAATTETKITEGGLLADHVAELVERHKPQV